MGTVGKDSLLPVILTMQTSLAAFMLPVFIYIVKELRDKIQERKQVLGRIAGGVPTNMAAYHDASMRLQETGSIMTGYVSNGIILLLILVVLPILEMTWLGFAGPSLDDAFLVSLFFLGLSSLFALWPLLWRIPR